MSPTCGIEYKRHSKSIDPARHLCGSCKGRLVQVQPAPRKECKRSDYRDFVKKEHERVRRENPSAGFGEIMAILGREFRENKRIEVEKVRNSKPADEPLIQTGLDTVDGLNSMVSKLVTLSLDL